MIIIIVCIVILVFVISFSYYCRRHEDRFKQKQNLVLITSVIHTIDKPLSYGPRSVISHEERFEQTINTILSIKKYIPNPYIVIIEGSVLTEKEKQHFYNAGCDIIHDVSSKLKDYINSPHKSVAEVHLILDYIGTIKNIEKYATLNKISGRYYLSDHFKWGEHAIYQCDHRPQCHTRYYRIPIKYFQIYKDTLQEALRTPEFVNGNIDIETFNIFRHIPYAKKLMMDEDEPLGVSGYIAPLGTFVEN